MSDTTIKTGMTNAGLNIFAQSQLGAVVKFTKIMIGDGELTGQDPAELTDLINPLETLGIYSGEVIKASGGNSAVKIGAIVEQASTGYFFREIGLYAIDPASNQEVLYAYGNKGNSANYIPANTSPVVVEESATIIAAIGNTENIIIDYSKEFGANRDLSNLTEEGLKKLGSGIFYKKIKDMTAYIPGIVNREYEVDYYEVNG